MLPETNVDRAAAPKWFDERGMFMANPGASRGEATPAAAVWVKNRDFLRLKDFALHLLDPRPGTTVFELGCGSGVEMVYCGLQGAIVYGVDLAATRVALANEKIRELGLQGEAFVGSALTCSFAPNAVDAVISSDFHEHLTDAEQVAVLREAWRLLKPGGRLVVKTPNLRYLRAALWVKRLMALARFRSPFGFAIPHTPGTADPEHIGLSTRTTLTRQLDAAGFVNWSFCYASQRRLGVSYWMDVLSTEIPFLRDVLCEDLFVLAFKPIALAHFPD